MHAAVVRSFDRPPHYEEVETPHPTGDQVLVDILAAGLHPRVRSGANGTHYTSDSGATGNAGQMAVQIARHLGAARIVAAGRDPRRLGLLADLGATTVVSQAGDPEAVADRLADAASDVDVVLDYTWGAPTEQAIPALVTRRTERARALTWIQIGSMAGPEITLPSSALRAANLQLMGSGQGSVSAAVIAAELPSLIERFAEGTLTAAALPLPLTRVEDAWSAPTEPGQRVVLTTTD